MLRARVNATLCFRSFDRALAPSYSKWSSRGTLTSIVSNESRSEVKTIDGLCSAHRSNAPQTPTPGISSPPLPIQPQSEPTYKRIAAARRRTNPLWRNTCRPRCRRSCHSSPADHRRWNAYAGCAAHSLVSIQQLSDIDLAAKTIGFKEKLAQGAPLDDLLIEAFGVVHEAGRRFLNMRHFDVQLIGGIVLDHGKISEMRTGEGKTLVEGY